MMLMNPKRHRIACSCIWLFAYAFPLFFRSKHKRTQSTKSTVQAQNGKHSPFEADKTDAFRNSVDVDSVVRLPSISSRNYSRKTTSSASIITTAIINVVMTLVSLAAHSARFRHIAPRFVRQVLNHFTTALNHRVSENAPVYLLGIHTQTSPHMHILQATYEEAHEIDTEEAKNQNTVRSFNPIFRKYFCRNCAASAARVEWMAWVCMFSCGGGVRLNVDWCANHTIECNARLRAKSNQHNAPHLLRKLTRTKCTHYWPCPSRKTGGHNVEANTSPKRWVLICAEVRIMNGIRHNVTGGDGE